LRHPDPGTRRGRCKRPRVAAPARPHQAPTRVRSGAWAIAAGGGRWPMRAALPHPSHRGGVAPRSRPHGARVGAGGGKHGGGAEAVGCGRGRAGATGGPSRPSRGGGRADGRRCRMQLNRTPHRMVCSGTGNRTPFRSGVCLGNRPRTQGDSVRRRCEPLLWGIRACARTWSAQRLKLMG